MKTTLSIATAALLFASCSGNADQNEEQNVEPVVYSLNVEKSTLKWHGEENEEHYHDGTISFKSGSFTMKGDEVVEGEFLIDPATISPQTEGYPAEKMEYLKGHLLDTAFLFSAEHPEVTVNTGAYNDGKLYTVINVRGVDIATEIPVQITENESGLSISGDFTVDFADAMMPYLVTPKEETGKPGAKSEIEFSMNLQLNKE